MYAEVIYETGSKAVVSYDDINALKSGLSQQHQKAVRGNPGGPGSHQAERIKRVLLYDSHPGELYSSGLLPVEALKEHVNAYADSLQVDGQVSIWQLISKLRELISPLTNANETGPHDSMHLAVEKDELDLDFLNTEEGAS